MSYNIPFDIIFLFLNNKKRKQMKCDHLCKVHWMILKELLFSFNRWENWALERLNKLSNLLWLVKWQNWGFSDFKAYILSSWSHCPHKILGSYSLAQSLDLCFCHVLNSDPPQLIVKQEWQALDIITQKPESPRVSPSYEGILSALAGFQVVWCHWQSRLWNSSTMSYIREI